MGSEIFRLNSLYMDDTVVRGSRINIKNAKETKTVQVNPGDDPQIKTGETGINAEYIVQASLIGNDLKGWGTFSNNSAVVSGYTGPQNIKNSDIIRLNTDVTFYNVTGIQGTDIYLTQKYIKKDASTPDVQSGPVTVRKIKLDSVQYETVKSPENSNYIYYDRDNTTWGITGIQPTGPSVATKSAIAFETGMSLQFLPGTKTNKADLLTIGSVYKTIVSNNTAPISDLSLSPLPYPHESLKVFIGGSTGEIKQKTEYEDYVVNYTQSPEFKTPRPPYEERQGAYIKFLDKLTDEPQVSPIDATFEGNVSITKKPSQSGVNLTQPISDIIPTDTFSIKIDGTEKRRDVDYIADYGAGIVRFVKHENFEKLIEAITYQKKLIWDGTSVIKGVTEDKVQNSSNLVISPIAGLAGITGMVYYEDTDQNNLTKDTDYTIDPESGAFSLTTALKSTESVLVSYYVEGDDVSKEKINLDDMRVNEYPVITGSVVLTEEYKVTQDNKEVTNTRVLIEEQDYTFSYITGRINLISLSADEEILSLQATYTPMAQINTILQPISGESMRYRMTIVDDIVKVADEKNLVFQINNPVVSVPDKILFQDQITTSNYTFSGSVLPDSLLWVKNEIGSVNYDVTGYKYKDVSKQISLDTTLSDSRPDKDDTVFATYSFESELLPYAPALVINTILNAGDDYILIEGFDRTDVLKEGMVLRIDNTNPENTYYFKIKSVTYAYGNTTVRLYGTYPEIVINPVFYLFDDDISWVSLPSGTTIDTATPVLSQTIQLTGDSLQIRQGIKKGCLILVNGLQIYTVTGVVVAGDTSVLSIFPTLQQPITGGIQYSSLPIHDNGDTAVPAKYFIMQDPTQPAFTLSYQAPSGFEGSAKILIDNKKIVITEAIRGIANPVPYEFVIAGYSDLYSLAKAIQGTPSTYRTNVPWAGVPDYNPFTIYPAGSIEEDYYLSAGAWSADLIIPFENNTPLDLPYTFQIIPEMFKWTLLQAFTAETSFLIKNADRTSIFSAGSLLAFRNRIDGKLYFFEVSSATLVDDIVTPAIKNTQVSLKDAYRLNLLNPTVYKYDSVVWRNIDNVITNIDYDTSEMTFNGTPQDNLRKSTMLRIADKYIYQVSNLTVDANSFTVTLSPSVDKNVRMETYHGYVKQSTVPIYLDDAGPQPFLSVFYTAPKGHTGHATIKVEADRVILTETLDNFTTNRKELLFKDYKNIVDLAEGIESVTSYTASVSIPEVFLSALPTDKFDNFRLKTTGGVNVALPNSILIAVSSFSIDYTTPIGYTGKADIKILDAEVVLTETIYNYTPGHDGQKVTHIGYTDAQSLSDLAQRVIPAVPSLVSASVYPFSCSLLNTDLFDEGLWGSTHIVSFSGDAVEAPTKVLGTVDGVYWYTMGPLNYRRLVSGTDYTIETGALTITTPMVPLDRFSLSYMGLWNLEEYEGSTVTCSCRYFSVLPAGSQVDVYMDYLNIDQFYLQKLTERKFSEIVVVPQVSDLLDQMTSGGQGSDSGADSNSTPNWQGGLSDLYYALRDEQIKKQLYVRFYHWYKERLRDLSAELQLLVGFKFAHSNALGVEDSGQYTLDDEFVETEDYTLTTDDDLSQINNGFSKFFPVGYSEKAPKYYDRFGTEYLTYNDVYCCNVTWTNDTTGKVETIGVVKSAAPYWKSGLDFVVWDDAYVTKNLVGNYQVDVPASDRTFDNGTYSFLKRISIGDKIKVSSMQTYLEISDITVRDGYEYLTLKQAFIKGTRKKKRFRGIRTFDVHLVPEKEGSSTMVSVLKNDKGGSISFNQLMDALPPDGFRIYVQRQSKEEFPMADDSGNLGATAYGEQINGQITNTRRIKKPFLASLIKLLFPSATGTENFKIMVKKDSEGPWEDTTGEIDLNKLSFKEERNVDDIMDSLRFDFTEIGTLPPFPPALTSKTLYDIKEKDDKGFHRYFYLNFEKIYDADAPGGYYEGIVLRARNREWWFRIVNGGKQDIVDDYGFDQTKEYRNFFDPDCMYKKVLMEKQAWETESQVIKDLYDHSDKIARAFDQGDLNRANSRYQGYLARQDITTLISTTFTVAVVNGNVQDSLLTGTDVPSGTVVTVSSTGNPLSSASGMVGAAAGAALGSGILPSPLVAGTQYLVINTGNKTCRLSTYSAVQAIDVNVTDVGTGTHTMTQVNPSGISDILMSRIPAYEKQLAFLINTQGPVYQTLYPDFVHPENGASTAIATTYQQTSTAWGIYNTAWQKEQFYKALNNDNNSVWKTDYVRWVLGLEPGLIYQKDARQMYDNNVGVITVGLREIPALNIKLTTGGTYTADNATVTVSSNYTGKYIQITCDITKVADPAEKHFGVHIVFDLYTTDPIVYKTLAEVCTDITSYKYLGIAGAALFSCEDIFSHFGNNFTSNMLYVSGVPVDPVAGASLSVASVSDHRDSDPRVLFLNRGIEDRVYTHGVRDVPGFNIKYLGNYYTHSADQQAIEISIGGGYDIAWFKVFLDTGFKKVLQIYSEGSIFVSKGPTGTFSLFNSVTGVYYTLNELIAIINNYTDPDQNYKPFHARLLYSVTPYGNLSAEYMVLCNETDGVYFGSDTKFIPYVHVNTDLDVIDTDINQGIYRIFYDTDFKKKIEIRFSEVIKDGSVIRTDSKTTTEKFVFYFQKDDLSFKTIPEICLEINNWTYKTVKLFSVVDVFQVTSGSPKPTTLKVVVDNTDRFLGFDMQATVLVDVKTVDISDPTSALSVLSSKNAYFSYPFYTANGNPNKLPIDGIPVSGKWDTTAKEAVLKVTGIDGTTWELTYSDFDGSSYKSYNPIAIVNKIDTPSNTITEAEFQSIATVEDQPQTSMIKELVLKRVPYVDAIKISEVFTANVTTAELSVTSTQWLVGDVVTFTTTGTLPAPLAKSTLYYVISVTGTGGSVKLKISATSGGTVIGITTAGSGTHTITRQYVNELKIGLREHSTINAVVDAINNSRFNGLGIVAPTPEGINQFFTAELIGDKAIQGEYKSFELDVAYLPIVRSFYVLMNNGAIERKNNFLVGWEIPVVSNPVNTSVTLNMAAKRYSPGDMYKFTMNPPDVAYTDTLSNNPQGFRRDTLAFDIYCWDDSGYYEVKDNWIYFRSAHIAYAVDIDIGQPDKTIGYGIPLAGSGHVVAPDRESVGDLLIRINKNSVVNKWFFCNLKFTRDSTTNPGFFEYDYLPNFHANIPKSKLDDVMLRDDYVMTLVPGSGYQFITSAYTVHDVANTIDLSCDWVYDYVYEKTYDFNNLSLNTITELAAAINTDLAAQIGASVFEANIVGAHGIDNTTDLLQSSGAVTEVAETVSVIQASEVVTANISDSTLSVARSDWQINDIVRFTTTGTLPQIFPPGFGLFVGVNYYVVSVSGTAPNVKIRISTILGGAALTFTSTGTGIHTIIRQSYDLHINRDDCAVNDVVQFTNSGGALPTPLALVTDYYVVSTAGTGIMRTIRVSLSFGGAPVVIADMGTGVSTIHRTYVNLYVAALVSALQIRVRSLSGVNYAISDATYEIPFSQDSLTLSCSIRYNHSFSIVGEDISPYNIEDLSIFISHILDYPDVTFPPLFRSSVTYSMYSDKSATRLLDAAGTITDVTQLPAMLHDLAAMHVLNMATSANVTVTDTTFLVVSTNNKTFNADMPVDKDLHTWIDAVLYGTYKQGMISIDTLPLKIASIDHGFLDSTPQKQLTQGNTPAHIFFGVLGDIQWIQISDYNLHVQMNYIKERLGQPWGGQPDYYTPETYNINNPYAIDNANFLSYMKTVRYNQIKSSIINEAVVANKYFWLYMKFHREFGCDQKAIALAKEIVSRANDQNILGQLS